MSLALVIPIPSQPRPEPPAEDTSPVCAKSIALLAEEMRKRGVTPDMLRPHPALAKYIAPLAELIAARGTP